MNNLETLRKFCYNHNIKVLDTNKRAYRHNKVNVDYFKYSNDYNMIDTHIVETSEPLYTVEIAESELTKIAELENQVFNNMRQQGHYDMFTYMVEQKEQEKQLRNRYPAVKKAYEQYSLMLKLAQSGGL